MNTAEQILVIFLSTALAIFLVLAIIIATQVMRVMKMVQEMAQKAQNLIDSAEATTDMIKNTVGQLSVMKFVHSIFDMVQKHSGNKKE
jgi:cell division protein FtsB